MMVLMVMMAGNEDEWTGTQHNAPAVISRGDN
jgi:hypothetical protein